MRIKRARRENARRAQKVEPEPWWQTKTRAAGPQSRKLRRTRTATCMASAPPPPTPSDCRYLSRVGRAGSEAGFLPSARQAESVLRPLWRTQVKDLVLNTSSNIDRISNTYNTSAGHIVVRRRPDRVSRLRRRASSRRLLALARRRNRESGQEGGLRSCDPLHRCSQWRHSQYCPCQPAQMLRPWPATEGLF